MDKLEVVLKQTAIAFLVKSIASQLFKVHFCGLQRLLILVILNSADSLLSRRKMMCTAGKQI